MMDAKFYSMVSRYARVWWRLAQMAFLVQSTNRWSSLGWLGGKLLRLFFFLIFLTAIFKHIPTIAGYSLVQVAIFFLTFNMIDIFAQILFRGIYMIGHDIREGDMDFYLIQPVNPLFRISSNMIDFLDLITLVPVVILIAKILPQLLGSLTWSAFMIQLGFYILLCINGLIIAFCIHVLIASVTVRTQQMENTIWLYRDMVSLGRFPIDIYVPFLRVILTVVFPIAVMVSYPTKMLLGILSPENVLFAFSFSALLVIISLNTWKKAVRVYSSVSS